MGACPICGGGAIVAARLGSMGHEWFCPECGRFQLESDAQALLAQHDLQPNHRRELSGIVARRDGGPVAVPLSNSFLQGELTRMGVQRLH